MLTNNQTVLILDFGGQHREVIARRVRECSVFSLIKPYNITIAEIKTVNPIAIIFTGGPSSIFSDNTPVCDSKIFELGIPILGIGYGMQLICHMLGGKIEENHKNEHGIAKMTINALSSELFHGLDKPQSVLMNYAGDVSNLPVGFVSLAQTEDCKFAAIADETRKFYGLKFHPENEKTKNGIQVIHNFLYRICGAKGDYTIEEYLKKQVEEIRAKVGGEKILLGLSGGVDSSVCAALISSAVPGQLVCIFVDHGFMRKNEADEIEEVFSKRKLEFVRVDSSRRFLDKIAGVSDPEQKRKIIGHEFIAVFEEQAKKYGDIKFLAQGTIYPDIIESGGNNTAVIKSHHNVGGLPDDIGFDGLIEPLRGLFKDEVRKIGRLLKLSPKMVNRQPFPGPGLAIRIIGNITEAKLAILREADAILREEISSSRIRARVNQYFAVLTNIRTVGTLGDSRTYDYTVALRAVSTSDFMTCDFVRMPYEILARISSRITSEVEGVNRVVYDITPKPPGTIEWE